MRSTFLALIIGLALGPVAQAAIVFSVRAQSSSPIPVGSTAAFDVLVRSDAGPVTDLRGLDFFLSANDPNNTGSVTSGGQFTQGIVTFPGGPGFIIPSGSPSSLAVFGASSAADVTIGSTDTLIATLTLATSGLGPNGQASATPGPYSLQLSGLTATLSGFRPFATVIGTPTLSYQVAVPEPNSFAWLTMTLAGFACRRAKRRVQYC